MEDASPELPPNTRLLPTIGPDGEPIEGYGSLWVPFGEGLEVPVLFEWSGTGPFHWVMTIQVMADGQPRCIALSVPGGMTAKDLRKFPVGRLLQEALAVAARPRDEIPKRRVTYASAAEAQRANAAAARQYRKVSPRRQTTVTPELLQRVADIYVANISTGAPAKAVASELGYSRPYARRLVAIARQRGVIGPAPAPRSLGEIPHHQQERRH